MKHLTVKTSPGKWTYYVVNGRKHGYFILEIIRTGLWVITSFHVRRGEDVLRNNLDDDNFFNSDAAIKAALKLFE